MENQDRVGSRNTGIDLLRIFAMYMIVISHYSVHNTVDVNMEAVCFDKFFLRYCVLGNLGVDVFFIISGYFSYGKKLKVQRLVSLEIEVLVYSIAGYVFWLLYTGNLFNPKDAIKAALPTLSYQYSFFTIYMLLIFLHKYIDSAIDAINENELSYLLILSVICFAIPFIASGVNISSYLTDAISCYLIGGILKKNKNNLSMMCSQKRILQKFRMKNVSLRRYVFSGGGYWHCG